MVPQGQTFGYRQIVLVVGDCTDSLQHHAVQIALRGRRHEVLVHREQRLEVPTYELLKAELRDRYLDYWPDPHAGRRWLKQDHAPAFAVRARPWAPPAPPASPPARMPWPVQLRAFR